MNKFEDFFFSLSDKTTRDMVWAVMSPSLLATPWSPEQPDWLAELLQQAPPLEHWQNSGNYNHSRLGLVFEQLWQQWFEQLGIRHQTNLQIRDDNKTLGELDLLIETNTGQLHLELALKFYMGWNNDWIGPNRRDHLVDKIKHTRDRQLQLARLPETQKQLAELGWQPEHSQSLMRGCLFYPTDTTIEMPRLTELNPAHWRGWWCRISEISKYVTSGEWVILSKDEWLSPVLSPVAASPDVVVELLQAHFRFLDVPLSIARVERCPTGWAEQERAMIVSDHWPQKRNHPG